MGEIYEARHLPLGRRVAIKLLSEKYGTQERRRRRFEQEAKALASLYSHCIVQVTDFGETDDGVLFMVMEYLDGEDLRARLVRQGMLPVGQAVSLILDACEGVGDAHAQGLVHRDLKPENLFITRGRGGAEHCKVVDFGIAKRRNAATFTREGALVGTVQYMAPEQVLGHKDLDDRVDVFALGAILFECLCGQPAFDGDKPEVILYRIVHDEPPGLRSLNSDLPAALERIVQRALSRDPASRYQNVAEFADALAQFAATPPPSALRQFTHEQPLQWVHSANSVHSVHSVHSASRSNTRMSRPWVQLAFAAVIALVFAGTWLVWRTRSADTLRQPVASRVSVKPHDPPVACNSGEPNAERVATQSSPRIAPEHTPERRDIQQPARAAGLPRRPVPPKAAPTLELDPNPYR